MPDIDVVFTANITLQTWSERINTQTQSNMSSLQYTLKPENTLSGSICLCTKMAPFFITVCQFSQ